MNLDNITKEEARDLANLARWSYARAALVAVNPADQRRLAWSVLVGTLKGFDSGIPLNDLLPEPGVQETPMSLDALMGALRLALASAFLDGPPAGMFAGDDAEEAWDDVLSRFIINSVRANVVIIDRGRYDELVKGQRK